MFSWSINNAIWLDKRSCCDKLWIKNAWKVSSFHFTFHSILFSVTMKLLRSLWVPQPMKIWLNFFFIFLLSVYVHKSNVIQSFHQEICAQRIIQFLWLKAFLVVPEEQEFPQIRNLYSKIENNINFYSSTLPAKINDKIFSGKTQFWDHFWTYFVVFAQREFLQLQVHPETL